MRLRFISLFVTLFLCAFASGAQTILKVDEASITATISGDQIRVELPVESALKHSSVANLHIQILDHSDKVVAERHSDVTVKTGTDSIGLSIPYSGEKSVDDLIWYRLKYMLSTNGNTSTGIVSMSSIARGLFELSVAVPDELHAGMRIFAYINAYQPITKQAVSSVAVRGTIKIDLDTDKDEDELKIAATGETDENGLAILAFDIPEDVKFENDWDSDIEIIGVKDGLTNDADDNLRSKTSTISAYFLTDKLIYQPEQKVFARVLLARNNFGRSSSVVADKDIEFSIRDEDGTVLRTEKAKTSRFGIAAIEWQIPESAKLGTYSIELKVGEDEDIYRNRKEFKVSRYDLPNFVVQTKSDHDFYLPGQTVAEATIEASYLFGKPVSKGKVKVVQESERKWNYSAQKWDVIEGAVYEGVTDPNGKFVARLDLTKPLDSLKDDDGKYKDDKYKDTTFTAYFTDLSTNRTEQRRFDIRVSKEPIHIHVTRNNPQTRNPKMPESVFLWTETADGKPISCDVEIKGKYDDEPSEKLRTLKQIRTNSLGSAKVDIQIPKRDDDIYLDDLDLTLFAIDDTGRTGTEKEQIEIDEDEKQISVRTDKTIYRKGESLKLDITSTENDQTVYVNISDSASSILTRTVRIRNGRARISIPYQSGFKGSLSVAAFFDDHGDVVKSSHGIIYPQPQNLQLTADTEKSVFRPNEEAILNLTVNDPNGKPSESALGVVISDRAVEERARSESNSGPDASIFSDLNLEFGPNLNDLDMKKVIPAEMQLFAEMRFQLTRFEPATFASYGSRPANVYARKIEEQFKTAAEFLESQYKDSFLYPKDENSLRSILIKKGIEFDGFLDPWGNKYSTRFSVERERDILEIVSSGPDKIAGNDDNFTAQRLSFEYFKELGMRIDKAINDYHVKTGKFVRNVSDLADALKAHDIDLGSLKDKWGEPYRIEFGISGRQFTVVLRSSGSDKKFSENAYEDFTIWSNRTDYFLSTEKRIDDVLTKFIAERKSFPKDEAEFRSTMLAGGVDFDSLLDGWGRPLYLKLEVATRFEDKITIEKAAKIGEASRETIVLTPVTRQTATFSIKSLGLNGIKDNDRDDEIFSAYGGIISEQTREDSKPKVIIPKTAFLNGKSSIYGVIADQSGAVITGVMVTVTNTETSVSVETISNSEGVFVQSSLPPGKYSVKATAAGFKSSVISEIKIGVEKLIEVNITLEPGGVSETVTVNVTGSYSIDTTNSSVATTIMSRTLQDLPKGTSFTSLLKVSSGVMAEPLSAGFQMDGASGSESVFITDRQEVSKFKSGTLNLVNDLPANQRKPTPRLREYFPETLLWQPEIITNSKGKAEVKFRFADNITTWKVYAVASDLNGKIGIAQKDVTVFQPFFVDLDPPKFLTAGDEIFLPTQVRNFTDKRQKVDLKMDAANWFSFISADQQQVDVEAGNSANAVFGFKATTPIKDAKQRVTAIAQSESDAIEKPVTVRPNGQEIVKTDSKVFNGNAAFNVDFPANTLPKTQRAELKIYPNLYSHVAESVEGLLERPYGCGEQTVSSTYPNLMLLKFVKPDSLLARKAKRYLQKGYDRLLGYQVADGGFTYWGGKDTSDIALTAYALRFLNDARSQIDVDEEVVKRAEAWLVKQQRTDGSWTKKYYYETVEDAARTKLITTYVARSIAMRKPADNAALTKAFEYLKTRNAEIDEPYSLALYGLASLDAGNAETATAISKQLEKMAIAEDGGVYWKLETNTPFYGWGTAGRIETTALVLQLLIRDPNGKPDEIRKELISKATLFLLKNKDRYGVWYSTQTTINVLDAFLISIGTGSKENKQTINVKLNGQPLDAIEVAAERVEPLTIDLTAKLDRGENKVEVSNSDDAALMSQLVASHYIDWKDADLSARNVDRSRALRLDYKCDKTSVAIMEEVTCAVEAERIGFQGYGMLLAEIGTPPGADVSRESLEKAVENDGSISRYDILPDRIVVYMWAKAGGTKFNFKFKPRYGITAQTPSSFVYDYYNPEAQATVLPIKFSVK